MADYYPLIARAVAGLDKNTGENRRALYERARAALVNQLRGVDPPLEESDITRERLALEEAIRKLEVEAAKRKPDTRTAIFPVRRCAVVAPAVLAVDAVEHAQGKFRTITPEIGKGPAKLVAEYPPRQGPRPRRPE